MSPYGRLRCRASMLPPEGLDKGDLDFTAVIEVYPDLETIDVSTIELDRPRERSER